MSSSARAGDDDLQPAIDRAGAEIAPLLRRPRVVVVTDETVAGLHLARLSAALQAEGIAVSALALPSGEATKGWPQFARCVEWLLEQKGLCILHSSSRWRQGRERQ